ncbi:MAG: DciA family protein, partial [Solirubrobacteraceae bacterium]
QSIDAWQQVLGVKIKNYIDELFVKNKILFVRINSPIMKKELEYRKTQTLQEIHQKVQNSFIVEINYI